MHRRVDATAIRPEPVSCGGIDVEPEHDDTGLDQPRG
jgi:hypothetical protein